MKVSEVKNGDVVTTTRLGTITVNNADYVKINAKLVNQQDMEIGDWLDAHPHADKIKDSDLTQEYRDKNSHLLR